MDSGGINPAAGRAARAACARGRAGAVRQGDGRHTGDSAGDRRAVAPAGARARDQLRVGDSLGQPRERLLVRNAGGRIPPALHRTLNGEGREPTGKFHDLLDEGPRIPTHGDLGRSERVLTHDPTDGGQSLHCSSIIKVERLIPGPMFLQTPTCLTSCPTLPRHEYPVAFFHFRSLADCRSGC